MTTRDEVREVLRTLPDDYLQRYVEAFEAKRLNCFPGNGWTACAVTVMAGTRFYSDAHSRLEREGFDSETVESFYEDLGGEWSRHCWGANATPLYDECVLELTRRAVPVPAEAVR